MGVSLWSRNNLGMSRLTTSWSTATRMRQNMSTAWGPSGSIAKSSWKKLGHSLGYSTCKQQVADSISTGQELSTAVTAGRSKRHQAQGRVCGHARGTGALDLNNVDCELCNLVPQKGRKRCSVFCHGPPEPPSELLLDLHSRHLVNNFIITVMEASDSFDAFALPTAEGSCTSLAHQLLTSSVCCWYILH